MTAVDDRRDMRIRASARSTPRTGSRRGAATSPWWVVAIQGIVGLVLGLWLLLNQGAGEPVLAVAGRAGARHRARCGRGPRCAATCPRSCSAGAACAPVWGMLAGLLRGARLRGRLPHGPAALVVLSVGLVVVGLHRDRGVDRGA